MAARNDEEIDGRLHTQLQLPPKPTRAELVRPDALQVPVDQSSSERLVRRNGPPPSQQLSPVTSAASASASPSVDATKPGVDGPTEQGAGISVTRTPTGLGAAGNVKLPKFALRSMSFDRVGKKFFARSSTGGLEGRKALPKGTWQQLHQLGPMQFTESELAGGPNALAGGIVGGPSMDSEVVDGISACSGSAWGGSECSFGVRELQDVPDTFQIGNTGPEFDPHKTIRSSFSKNQERAERKLADHGGKRELVSLGEFLKDPKRVRTLNRRVVDLLTFEGCEDLRRGTPLTRILRQQARIFARSTGSSSTYTMSQPVSRIDGFISHNWSVPRHHKFLSLCFHYNLPIAATVTAIFMMLVGLFTAFNLLPELELADSDHPEGIVCRVCCAPLFLCVAVFVRDFQHLVQFFGGGPIVFLDKTCIHQEDMAVQKKGIEKLGAYLCNSTEMLVLYTDVYLRRLWTVYEVASYFAVKRELTSMKVIPVVIPEVFFGSVAVLYCASTLQVLMIILFDFEYGFHMVMPFCAFVGLFAARKWARAKKGVTSLLSDFTIQKCECSSENDRAAVCKNVAALMRETQVVPPFTDDAGATAAFDELARNELPHKLSEAMGRHVLCYWQAVLAVGITRGPSWVDRLAGLQHGMATREFLFMTITCWSDILFLYPIFVALFEVTGCWFLDWTGYKELGWLAAVVLVWGSIMVSAVSALTWCAEDSVHSDLQLGILIGTTAVLGILTLLMYSGLVFGKTSSKDSLQQVMLEQESERPQGIREGSKEVGDGDGDADDEGDGSEKESQASLEASYVVGEETLAESPGKEASTSFADHVGLSNVMAPGLVSAPAPPTLVPAIHQREPHAAEIAVRKGYHSVTV